MENNLLTIEDGVLMSCNDKTVKSVEIPDSVTKIGNSAFSNCELLEEIKIPESVTEIGNYVFSNCESLKKIIISNGVTKIGIGVFVYCKSLNHIEIPSRICDTIIKNYFDVYNPNCKIDMK